MLHKEDEEKLKDKNSKECFEILKKCDLDLFDKAINEGALISSFLEPLTEKNELSFLWKKSPMFFQRIVNEIYKEFDRRNNPELLEKLKMYLSTALKSEKVDKMDKHRIVNVLSAINVNLLKLEKDKEAIN